MRLAHVLLSTFLVCFFAGWLLGQGTTVTTISGTITDPSGAVIPNAQVHVTERATGRNFDVTANTEGHYAVTDVSEGTYTIEASAPGFKSKVVENAKVDVGTPLTVNVQLEVGAASEKVEVQANATQVETATATVGTTVTGRQITELPFTSRDALDLALLTPGSSANGAPRESSFNGLPHDALNITMDGIDTQDNLLKSSSGGGMYTYIRPRVDAIDEFNISSAVEGADSSSEGAIQIKFETKRGTNEFHGGLYEYFRNTDLDANYYFNNETGQPRQQLKLNQFGGKVGGPILKNKLFFFINAEGFKLPESNARQRITLTPAAAAGNFTYTDSSGHSHTVNVLSAAAAAGYPSTINPEIGSILGLINANIPNVGITPINANEQYQTFNTTDSQSRYFVTSRFDYNITQKLHWEFIYNYDYFYDFPDSLNSYDAPFPNLVTYQGYNSEGGQISNRFSGVTALQWTISPTMTNEIRAGLQGGTGIFDTEVTPQGLPGGLRLTFPSINGNTLYSPVNRQPSQWRNTPVKQISDTLNWVKGNHTLSMGGNGTLVSFYGNTISGLTPAITFGVTGTDPVSSVFTNQTYFPGIQSSTSDTTYAATLYAFLTGRVSGASGQYEYLNENTKQYVAGEPLIERDRQHEFGFFLQDNWKYSSNLTFNGGIRWEFEGSPYDANDIYYTPTYAGLWGLSGIGNLFEPGVMNGSAPNYIRTGKPDFFNSKLNNFAPNVGIAYAPHSDHSLLKWIFGQGGAFRAGYGISFIRDGMDVFEGTEGANPGTSASGTLTADTDFPAGSALLGSSLPAVRLFPGSAMDPLPASTFTYRGVSGYAADPNLQTPYVQSWSAGIQREIGHNTVLEVRYVGNHAIKLLRTYNLNEVNILSNGFLQNFVNAQNNLAINAAHGKTNNFSDMGYAGEQATPILNAAFKSYSNTSSSGYASGTFITDLQEGIAGTMANTLAGSSVYMGNLIGSGYPSNFFQVNPTLAGASAYLTANGGFSNFNSIQVEVRHRFSNSIQFSANYMYMKSLTNMFVDSAVDANNYVTLRNYSLNTTISPYNIPNQFKANFIYELPFGPGHAMTTSNGFINRIIGGWQAEGIIRIQSGSPFILNTGGTRGTLNQYDSGIVTNLTRAQIQSDVGVYKMPNGTVYWLNPNANLVNISGNGQANSAYIAPASTPGVLGNPYFYLYGPMFCRFDLTAAKKTRITEKTNLELRAEFLDAFNNVNFIVGSAGNSVNTTSILSSSFGRLTNGYQDISTTNDPGGRIIQLVARFNF